MDERAFTDPFTVGRYRPLAIDGKKAGICDLVFDQNQASAAAQKSFQSIPLRRRELCGWHCEHNSPAGRIGPPMVTRVVNHFECSLAVLVCSLLNRPAELYLRLRGLADAIAGAHQCDP